MTPEALGGLWSEIEKSLVPRSSGWIRRQTNPGASVPIHAAVACVSGARSLMFDIPITALGVLHGLPVTGGLAIRLAPPLDGVPSSQRTLLMELEDREYNDIFAIFCAHVIDGMSRCTKGLDATTLLLERVARWQEFLLRSREHLSKHALTGLFGELWLLREVLVTQGGVGTLASWTGAQQAPQDFVFPGVCAFEVKTSILQRMTSVTIHGEHQLDDTGLRCLFLVCLRLELNDKGESVNEVVAALRSRASVAPEFATEFDMLLARAGWLARHAPYYEEVRFIVAEERYFRVTADFPRLLPASLVAGVDEVDYRLELKACGGHECSRTEIEMTLSTLDIPPPLPLS